MTMTSDDDQAPRHPAKLISLAERWRVAGVAMRRKDPLRFARHLHALEIDCVEIAAISAESKAVH